jgi:hypothetical protein
MLHGFPADSGREEDVSKPYLPNQERPSVLPISGAFPWLQFSSPLAYRPHPLIRRAQAMEAEARTSIAAERDFVTSMQAIELAAAHAPKDSGAEPAAIAELEVTALSENIYTNDPSILAEAGEVSEDEEREASETLQQSFNHATSYLNGVKVQFADHPDIYVHFLNVMLEWRDKRYVHHPNPGDLLTDLQN